MDPTALGRYLRESREAKELTLDNAVSVLHIRRPILEAFERGDFTVGETPVQVRGLLRNYARYLDLDEERVLQYYEAAISPKRRRGRFRKRRETQPIVARRITDTPPALPAVQIPNGAVPVHARNVWRNVMMLLVSAAALAVIVFVTTQILSVPQAPANAAPESTIAPALGSTTATATFMPTSTALPPSNTPPFAAQGFVGIQVRLSMTQRSWVQVVVDDSEQLAGILEPGQVVEFDASTSVTITAANAAGIQLTVNGQVQQPFGQRGQQAVIAISSAGVSVALQGEVSPTPMPFPTNTSLPSATPFIPTATAVQVNTIGQPTAVETNNTPTPALPTPTSIFDNPPSSAAPQSSTPPLPDTANANVPVATSTEPIPVEASPTPEPTATPTPTTQAVLPIRATSANPTPTKSG